MLTKKEVSRFFVIPALNLLTGCATATFPTVSEVELNKFMGSWYVAAGRFTPFEKEVHNAVEVYNYDEKTKVIDIDFTYRKGAFDGELKKIPQTATIVENTRNAHWKVSPFWPFKFDYLVIALAEDYSWTAIGVPDQEYLWIMFRKNNPSREEVQVVIDKLNEIKYDTGNLTYVPQKWPAP